MGFPTALYSQGQLEIATGGADKLRELVDKQKTGQLASASCQAFLAEVHAAALGEVCAILQVAFDPSDPTFQGADFVKQNGVTIGLYWTWHKSTGGIAIPNPVKDAHAEAVASLEKARDGLRSLGTEQDPASNVGSKMVKLDTTGTRVTRGNMGGFC